MEIGGKFVPSSNYNYRLPREDIDKIFYVFSVFDEDGDGVILAEEVPQVLRALGELIIESKSKKIVREFFSKDDKPVDLTKFMVGMANYYRKQFTYDESSKTWMKPLLQDISEMVTDAFLVTFPEDTTLSFGNIEAQLTTRGDIIPGEELAFALDKVQRTPDREFEFATLIDTLLKPIDDEANDLRVSQQALSPRTMSPAITKKPSFLI